MATVCSSTTHSEKRMLQSCGRRTSFGSHQRSSLYDWHQSYTSSSPSSAHIRQHVAIGDFINIYSLDPSCVLHHARSNTTDRYDDDGSAERDLTFSFPTPSTLLCWVPSVHPSNRACFSLSAPSFAAHRGTATARANKQTEPGRSDDDATAAARKGSRMCVVFLPQRIPRPFSISDFCARDMPYKLMTYPPRLPGATHYVLGLEKCFQRCCWCWWRWWWWWWYLLNSDRTGNVRKNNDE